MATVVNARDIQLQSVTPRVATVTMADNIQVSQDNVTGLGLVVEGTKYISASATSQIFQINKDGTISPSSILATIYKRNLTASPSISVVAGSASLGFLVDGTLTITPEQLLTDAVTIRVTLTENSKTYTDDLTIVKVREGADSLTAFLTNETHTLPSDTAGNVTNYSGASGQFRVFKGSLDVTSVCTFAVILNPDNLSCSMVPSGTDAGTYAALGNMPSGSLSSTLTLRATFGSATLDKVFTISKAIAGAVGQRGSRTFYVPLTGSTATFSDSLATTTASSDGGPIKLDTVVQYNDSVGFSQTKFWDGSSWLVVNAVVDGNLLVSNTVGANAFVGGLFQGDNVLTRNMTIRDSSGNVLFSSGQNLDFSRIGGSTKPANNATVGATIGVNLGGQIDASNVSTYIAAGVITDAYIGNVIKSTNFNGTIDSSGNITAVGTAGWAISKVGHMVLDAAYIRGKLTTGQIEVGAVSSTAEYVYNSSSETPTSGATIWTTAKATVATVSVEGGVVRLTTDIAVSANTDDTNADYFVFTTDVFLDDEVTPRRRVTSYVKTNVVAGAKFAHVSVSPTVLLGSLTYGDHAIKVQVKADPYNSSGGSSGGSPAFTGSSRNVTIMCYSNVLETKV